MRHSAASLALVASLACATSAPSTRPEPATLPAPAASPGPAAEVLAADSPRATPGGATFTAPAGWSVLTRDTQVVLAPPERDSHLVLVDVRAADADAAAAAAWTAWEPAMKRPLRLAVDRPARQGWEQRRVYTYETSPNERAVLQAIVLRKGDGWTVLLMEGSESTFEKRSAPIGLIAGSLRPKGYARESFAGRQPHALDPARIAQIKSLLEKGMAEVGVPGVGFSLIDGGKVVFEGGLGVKELGKPGPVDANTLFLAASNTKAMTTFLLARLVDAKKLSWEQPVVQVFPQFKLGDAETTGKVLVKHLVCACTGLPRQDLEWIFEYKDATPASALRVLGTMQPTSKFGEVFQYSNLMAAAAGYLAGSLFRPGEELGAAYDAAMQAELFDPLGMSSTTFDLKRVLKGNHASPHGLTPEGKVAVASLDLDYSMVPVRPAGGAWTSAHDLSQYVLLELRKGKLADGTQLVSAESLAARTAPQIMLGEDASYGMALMVDRRLSIPFVHHGGDMPGYHSDMVWLPGQGVGGVILTNGDNGWRLRGPFIRKLLEVVFDGRPEAEEDLASSAKAMKEEIAKERERLQIPADAGEASRLAPRYRSSALGEVAVLRAGGKVVFDVGEWKSEVASRKNDDGSISFVTIDPALAGFEFVVAGRAGKRALVVRDGQHEYFFDEAN